jgi:hypothetical protein
MGQYLTREQGYAAAVERFKELVEQYRLPGPGASAEWNEGWREAWRQIAFTALGEEDV